jgi:ABC-type enterochelin transport system substrate-binding protein
VRKKVFVTISLISFMLLSACNTNAKYVPWAGESANQIERLNEAGIDYKTQKGEIWIKEKDVKKAVQCCS